MKALAGWVLPKPHSLAQNGLPVLPDGVPLVYAQIVCPYYMEHYTKSPAAAVVHMLKTAGHQGAAAGQLNPSYRIPWNRDKKQGEGGNEEGSILQCSDPRAIAAAPLST